MAPCHTLFTFILTITATLAAASPEKKSTSAERVSTTATSALFLPTGKEIRKISGGREIQNPRGSREEPQIRGVPPILESPETTQRSDA
ncbi:hypothetical protein S83_023235 [Arachis hypogaea]